VALGQNAPILSADYVTIQWYDTVSVNILLNDSDPDGDSLSIAPGTWQSQCGTGHFNTLPDSAVSISYYPSCTGVDTFAARIKESDPISGNVIAYHYDTLYVSVVPGNRFARLDANNVNAAIHHTGDLFWDLVGGPLYEVPKGSQVHSLFAANMWIGGISSGGQLRLAANTYRQTGTDFWVGPVARNYTIAYDDKYKRLWEVHDADIEEQISLGITYDVAHGGIIPLAMIPKVVQEWPAHGSVVNGESFHLAPFIDLDADSWYEPEQGDYPHIRGCEAIYLILNDDRAPHTETGGLPMGLEIHVMAYAYDVQEDSALDFTTFMNYRIINRSASNYHDVFLGMWTDGDLGLFTDDYMGSDSVTNSYFYYNGDAIDEGITGYGASPPAQSITFLNEAISHFRYYNNDFSVLGNPENAQQYYYLMKTLAKDASPTTSCGVFHPLMYPGHPGDGGCSMYDIGEQPSDRRGVGSTGPFNLASGEEKEFDIAFVWARDTALDNIEVVGLLKQRIQEVIDFYNNPQFTCDLTVGGDVLRDQTGNLLVMPNPSNGQFIVKLPALSGKLVILDALGRVAYSSEVLGQPETLVSLKHPSGVLMLVFQSPELVITERIVLAH
jgi:hypothetical protein